MLKELQGIQYAREEGALSKIFDPFTPPYPIWHETGIENLASIMSHGIMARGLTKEKGIETKSIYQSPWNEEYVSVFVGIPVEWHVAKNISLLINPNIELTDPGSIETGRNPRTKVTPLKNEMLVRERINPTSLTGIVVGVDSGLFLNNYRQNLKNLNMVVEVMENIPPSHSLPVYYRMDVIWPVKMCPKGLRQGNI